MVSIIVRVSGMPTLSRPIRATTPVLLSAVVLTACTNADTGTDTDTGATESSAASPASSSTHDHGDDHDHGAGEQAQLTEVASIVPRVVLAHDGGITVIDSETGETVSETDLDGFLRLNNSGDGRHVMVTAGDRFLAFDAAVQSRAHGDHAHNYAGDPSLTDIAYDEPEAGHVVVNEGLTALFSDGDGTARIVPTDQVAAGYRPAEGVVVDSGAPHHGVAVPFADGSVLITVGDEDNRQRIEYRDAEGKVQAHTDDCPGIHGEAMAAEGAVVFGCQNGPVVFDGTDFRKVDPGTEYQRSGNLAGHADSPIILGDHKVDEDAELERPTEIALIDTRNATMRTVDLGSSYWFRSLGRGPAGEAVVLTYDGHLKVIDPESGEIIRAIPAIAAWEEKDEWQEPGPVLRVVGDHAYVTDAENNELVVVDLTSGEEAARHELPITPVEMAVADGKPAAH